MMQWLVILVAVVGGMAVAVQGQLVGLMDRTVGTLGSTFITYGGGGVLIGIILLVARSEGIANWRVLPPWTALAGLTGVVIIGSISYTVARVGLVAAFMILTVSQFAVSAVIDHYGLLGAEVRLLDTTRVAGLTLLVIGTWLALR